MISINGKQMLEAGGVHHSIGDTLRWFDAKCAAALGGAKVREPIRGMGADRVRAPTAGCHSTPKPRSNAGRRQKLTTEAIETAERMIYHEGQSYLAAAKAIGCSQSRVYAVLAERRHAMRKGGAA